LVGALTQEIHIPRFELLNLVLGCGNLEEMTPWLIAERDESLSFSIANEHPPGTSVFAGGLFSSHLRRKASFRRVCGDPERKFQDLRAMCMTKKRESEGGNPPSGRKNPELLCLVLSTRGKKDAKNSAGTR